MAGPYLAKLARRHRARAVRQPRQARGQPVLPARVSQQGRVRAVRYYVSTLGRRPRAVLTVLLQLHVPVEGVSPAPAVSLTGR